ncbi:MAG: cell envelope biogenesis protein TonB [Bacteroidia bacterium]|nr:MAG: cell envelope biogenesis protein TonB [Bacteroidia bacterium]
MLAHQWYNLVSDARNEIVFQNRNKKFGAYKLRKEYNKTMLMILLSLILLVVVAGIISNILQHYVNDEKNEKQIKIIPYNIIPDNEIIVNPPTLPPNPPTPALSVKTDKFVAPIFKDSPKQEDTVATQQKLNDSNANIGISNSSGDTITSTFSNSSSSMPSNIGSENSNEIIEIATVMPEFPGGHSNMVKFILNNIKVPEKLRMLGSGGKCYLSFVVNQDGSISDIVVLKGVPNCSECDAEAVRVVKSMPLWKPGKQNNQPARVRLMLPINFTVK